MQKWKHQMVRRVAALGGVGLALGASGAHAAIDVSGVTTTLSDGSTAVAAIGVAALAVLAVAALFKYVRRAF